MQEGFDSRTLDEALAECRFEDADRLVDSAPTGSRHDLRERVEEARTRAVEEAQERYGRIIELGTEGDQEAVASLRKDPRTSSLLALLPKSSRRHAEAYLGAAGRWEAAQRRTAERRLSEARRALDEFDLQLAKGLAHRVERRFLSDGEALDRLLLDIEARAMELAPLREAQRQMPDDRSRPWWRRRRR